MESLSVFMGEKYVMSVDSRLSIKTIYEDFKNWVISKLGSPIWNKISKKEIYDALKNCAQYAYVRYREGYCLRGITYKPKDDVVPKTVVLKLVNKWKGPPTMAQNVLPRAFQGIS